MYLEQVIPLLREGKTITRSKPFRHEGATLIFVKIEESKLKFRCIWSNGEQMKNWASYRIRAEDLMAENWEIAG